MTIQDVAAIVGAVVTGLAGLFAMLRFLVKHYLNELRPNSGSSMKDQITRLEARVDTILDMLGAGK
jgi:hypothetical protein